VCLHTCILQCVVVCCSVQYIYIYVYTPNKGAIFIIHDSIEMGGFAYMCVAVCCSVQYIYIYILSEKAKRHYLYDAW